MRHWPPHTISAGEDPKGGGRSGRGPVWGGPWGPHGAEAVASGCEPSLLFLPAGGPSRSRLR